MMLIRIEDHITAFTRAHQAVLDELGGPDRMVYQQDRFQLMKDQWAKQHRAEIPGPPRAWTHIQFPTEQAYMIWLMRWS